MKLLISCLAVLALSLGLASYAMADSADVLFVVDESGSMGGEHAWLSSMVSDLDSGLLTAGWTGNYALVGYGGYSSHLDGHKHAVGGGDWGTASQLSSATSGLQTNGGTEDGWEAIMYALNNYTFSGDALNIVLVTDEDRDTRDASLTYASMLSALKAKGALLNVVVDMSLTNSATGATLLGIDAANDGYKADGSGGYTTAAGPSSAAERQYYNSNNLAAYASLAWATGGATWDLGQLRAGGSTATSFTSAFVDIKVEEIQNIVPEPGTLALLGLGLACMGVGLARRRKVA